MTIVSDALQNEARLVAIAREIAQDIHPLDRILKNYGVSTVAFEAILRHPRFQVMLSQQIDEWNAASSTPERIRVKSLAALEDSLLEIHARVHDGKETLSAKVEALKLLKALGGLGERDTVVAPGAEQRFRLEIVIGETRPKVIDVTPTPGVIDA